MKFLERSVVWLLVAQLSGWPALLAQPVIIQPGSPFGAQQNLGSGIDNLRISQQSPDGAEAHLTMDYSYDGFGGPVAQILPVIGKKGQKGVSAWFGADPVTVGRGRGTITLRVRYFNDEPGVPAVFTSDQLRILILNQSGTAILTAVPFLKNINWGNPNGPKARPGPKPEAPLAATDPAAAHKLAQEKRAAEEKARQEAATREKARLLAEAEVKSRKESEEKARAEAAAREEARQKAQAEAERIALENKKADEVRLAQQKAREEEQKRAEAIARAKAEAEAKALADARDREEARKRAEADAKRRDEQRKLAEAQQRAEEKARLETRLKAEAEAKRLAEEKRVAEEKALAETAARKQAEEKARQEALAQAAAELAAKKLQEEKAQAEALVKSSTTAPALLPNTPAASSLEIAQDKKTKITNVDVVNRSIDRTQMTFGVEFEYKDQISDPMLGIDVLRDSEPQVRSYFVSRPMEIGKSRRNFALLPVKFQPPGASGSHGDFTTDKVVVYLTDKPNTHRYNIYPATMLLRWRAAGDGKEVRELANANLVEIDDFKQNDPSTGYVSVKYNLLNGRGKLRAKIYDQNAPQSAAYFTSTLPEIPSGRGVQLIDVRIDSDAKSPSDLVRADTIEVELTDAAGKVLSRTSRQAAMVWARPK